MKKALIIKLVALVGVIVIGAVLGFKVGEFFVNGLF